MRLIIAALAAGLALAACGEARRAERLDPRLARPLAAVRLDSVAATAMLTAWRREHGLGPVRLDPALNAMAQRQADSMVAANDMSHGIAGSLAARLAAAGVRASEAGENLGEGYFSTGEAMRGWQNSPGHNANLLLPKATRFGIAIAKDPHTSYGVYWTLIVAAEPLPTASATGLMIAPGSL
jgi:uncharacterized protein YkwD